MALTRLRHNKFFVQVRVTFDRDPSNSNNKDNKKTVKNGGCQDF